MSVAGSCRSSRSVGTVVGNRTSDGSTNDNDHGHICNSFVLKLGLDKYFRDRKEIERDVNFKGIRINSRKLAASYDVPTDKVYDVLKVLHSLLAPGLRNNSSSSNGSRQGSSGTAEASREQQKTYRNWHSKTDFTVQLKPKAPSVLWMDLECMPCKEKKVDGKHVRTREVLPIIIKTLLKSLKEEDVKMLSNPFYVSRGLTDGMHLFFPDIIISSEMEMVKLWKEVNRELRETHQNIALIDEGCSAMPLPCSRYHSGLNRVVYSKIINSDQQVEIVVNPKSLYNPVLQDLARFTNFYHLVADRFEKTSPPASITGSECSKRADASQVTDIIIDCHRTNMKIPPSGALSSSFDKPLLKEGSRDLQQHMRKCDKDLRPIIKADGLESINDNRVNLSPSSIPEPMDDNNVHNEDAAVVRIEPPNDIVPTEYPKLTLNDEVLKVHEQPEDSEASEILPETMTSLLAVKKGSLVDTDTERPRTDPGDCTLDKTLQDQKSNLSEPTTSCDFRGTENAEGTMPPMDMSIDPSENEMQWTEMDAEPFVDEPITIESGDEEVDDERAPKSQHSQASSSSSSSGKRRLRQSDIRDICKNYKRKCRSDRSVSELSSKSWNQSMLPQRGSDNVLSANTNYDDCNSSIRGGVPPSTLSSMQSIRSGVFSPIVSSVQPIGSRAPSSAESSGRTRRCHTLTDEDATSVNSNTDQISFTERAAQSSSSRVERTPSVSTSPYAELRALYVSDDTIPTNAHLPNISITASEANVSRHPDTTKEAFRKSMSMDLGQGQNKVHVTDIDLIVSGFNTEYDFYKDMMEGSIDLNGSGLRIKEGGSLNARRENCPAALFPEYIPHVLYSEDFVSETTWTSVLVRYYDEYLNNAPFLYIMSKVLQTDDRVQQRLSEETRSAIQQSVDKCLRRFRNDMVGFQIRRDRDNGHRSSPLPKHTYTDKCMVVIGLIAISSFAFKIVTPLFTDMAKICRLLAQNNKQTLGNLNTSSMSTITTAPGYYDMDSLQDGEFSPQAQFEESEEESVNDGNTEEVTISANLNNDHSVLASILRWNYNILYHDTLWGLFFYYHHVHTDGLGRILNEVVHGGVMVTAMLQAYFESCTPGAPVNTNLVFRTANGLYSVLSGADSNQEEGDEDRGMMPPPAARGRSRQPQQRQRSTTSAAQRSAATTNNTQSAANRSTMYKVRFNDVLEMMFHHYLRPTCFGDEGQVLYNEKGYERITGKKDYDACFARGDKDKRQAASDLFSRSTKKYSMSHGDLLMYYTDVPSSVNARCCFTYNLVLNVFENMHGGCMTFLMRHFKKNLEIFNRFHGDAYRLVVECRHAMNELIQSIELSYINLILRQPIVPPLLESDVEVRDMFLSSAEVQDGAFVCLNAMDYERAINMFTKRSRVSKENCKTVELFLDYLIRGQTDDGEDDARTRFRTVYLFFLLYQFEVLYKIRHVYNTDQMAEVSIDGVSRDLDVSGMLRLFFGECELKLPRGLSSEVLENIGMSKELYTALSAQWNNSFHDGGNNNATNSRCVNTRPLVCTTLPNKVARMRELFGRKGLSLFKSYGPLCGASTSNDATNSTAEPKKAAATTISSALIDDVVGVEESSSDTVLNRGENSNEGTPSYVEQDRAFLALTPAELIDVIFKSNEWYGNCEVRMKATAYAGNKNKAQREMRVSLDPQYLMTFCESILLLVIKTGRLNHIETSVREKKREFAFCTEMPLRCKMIAFVMAVHSAKRLTHIVADDFVRKEFRSGRSGVLRTATNSNVNRQNHHRSMDTENDAAMDQSAEEEIEPEIEWFKAWSRLLLQRRPLLLYCRELAKHYFPHNYFVGLQPDKAYNALFTYMVSKASRYTTLSALKDESWAVRVCTAMNYLLIMNAYDPELVEFCLQLFLSFEWPGQWAKRIFVWKSNSNAGKSLFLEHVISKAFYQSTSINDPKGGKENAPEKSEYHKNFLLMINEFSSAVTSELKKLCSTSGYTYRMNFGNEMIHSFMVGKLVFNCNTLPMTTDHATIQRVALIPLPFWFQYRQSVVDAMMNWTRNHSSGSDYDMGVRRNISKLMTSIEKDVFKKEAKKDFEDFIEPNVNTRGMFSEKVLSEITDQVVRSAMFLVQNKTSQVYLLSNPPLTDIVSGIVTITKYFCRFRFFNTIKEPVDLSKLPTACNYAMKEWQMVSQPYFEWKACCKVYKDTTRTTKTKASVIYASLQKFAKNYIRNTSFFDLRQFFECDFSEERIPGEGIKEDEYYVVLQDLED